VSNRRRRIARKPTSASAQGSVSSSAPPTMTEGPPRVQISYSPPVRRPKRAPAPPPPPCSDEQKTDAESEAQLARLAAENETLRRELIRHEAKIDALERHMAIFAVKLGRLEEANCARSADAPARDPRTRPCAPTADE
jgi:hypothetical protein